MIPNVFKTQTCIKCGGDTAQRLVPSILGCDWRCEVCKNTLLAYTFADMNIIIQKYVFNVSADEKQLPQIPANYQVFLKCEFADLPAKEMEASAESVLAHVKATGKLPQVGKSLYATVQGARVPYGEVVRIQSNGTNI